jgi:hypothetical protein
MKLDPRSHEPSALETSIYSYKAKDKLGKFSIDLISAVHIADKDYFLELNQIFKSYDHVLFEVVADKDGLSSLKSREPSQLSGFQSLLAKVLDLSFQLDHIDYSADNFMHADMSAEQLAVSMKERGESFGKLVIRTLLKSFQLQNQGASSDLSDLLLLASGNHSAVAMKRMLAREFGDISDLLNAINGAEGHSLISGRNKVAINKAIQSRKQGKDNIAIFYGAAHMPDFCEQFKQIWTIENEQHRWLSAWDLRVMN